MGLSAGPGARPVRGVQGRRLGAAALWMLVASACAGGGDPSSLSSTFGDPTVPMTAAMTSAMGDDGGDDDGGTGGSSDTDNGGSVGGGDATDDTGSDGAGDQGSEGAGDGPQPDNGMYSHCLSTAECVGVNTCVTIFDMAGVAFDGFCTLDNCEDPAADCDPAPGGTAVVSCVSITLNDMAASACALDCTGGLTCPSGMICYEDDGVPVCA